MNGQDMMSATEAKACGDKVSFEDSYMQFVLPKLAEAIRLGKVKARGNWMVFDKRHVAYSRVGEENFNGEDDIYERYEQFLEKYGADIEGSGGSKKYNNILIPPKIFSYEVYSIAFDKLSITGKNLQGDFREIEINVSDLQLTFEPINEHASLDQESWGKQRQNTILKIILGMAINHYGYDSSTHNEAAVKISESLIKVNGEKAVHEKTISKYLELATERLGKNYFGLEN